MTNRTGERITFIMPPGIIALIVISVSILIFAGAFRALARMLGFASNTVKSIMEDEDEPGGEPHFDDGLSPNTEIKNYTEKIAANPDDFNLYHERGKCYEEMEDYERALSDYSHSLKLNPVFTDALIRRGVLNMEEGNAEAAQKDFEILIAEKPEEYTGYELMGNLLFRKGEFSEAVSNLAKAINRNEEGFSVNLSYEKRSYAYFCLGSYKEALADIERTIDLSRYVQPGDDIYLYRFIILNRLGIDGTKELFAFKGKLVRESLLNSSELEWLHRLIRLYLDETDPTPCIEEMNRLSGESSQGERPKCVMGFYISQWFLMKKEKDNAEKFLQICLESGIKNADQYIMAKAELKRL